MNIGAKVRFSTNEGYEGFGVSGNVNTASDAGGWGGFGGFELNLDKRGQFQSLSFNAGITYMQGMQNPSEAYDSLRFIRSGGGITGVITPGADGRANIDIRGMVVGDYRAGAQKTAQKNVESLKQRQKMNHEEKLKMYGGYGTNKIIYTDTEKAALVSYEVNETAGEKWDKERSEKELSKYGMKKLADKDIDSNVFKKLIEKGFVYNEDTGNFDHESGLRVGVYQDENGKIFISYIGYGNNSFKDMVKGAETAIKQTAFGEDQYGQYNLAKDIGTAFYKAYGDKLIITGQSLGGGLASAAGVETGARTITFNAAGLHPKTVNSKDYNELINKSAHIESYIVKGECVQILQESILSPFRFVSDAAGSRAYLNHPNTKLNMVDLHHPKNILPALNKYYYEKFYSVGR